MKNKHKRQFLNTYKWWDYSYLLLAMEHWFDNASKITMEKGVLLHADRTAHRMKICAELCKRIREDNSQRNEVFKSRNYRQGCRKEFYKYTQKRKTANLRLLTDMMNKHLLSFWD